MDSRSRYKKSAVIRRGDKETFGLVRGLRILDHDFVGDKVIRIKITPEMVHRPDMVALEAYGDERLYWIVVLYNNPRSIFRWPTLGEVITIPNRDLVISEM